MNELSVIEQDETSLPAHLSRLPGTKWGVWNWCGLRGAGLPVTLVLKLAAPECASAADRYLLAEEEVERTRHAVLDVLREEVKTADKESRTRLGRVKKLLYKGRYPDLKDVEGLALYALAEEHLAAGSRMDAARAQLHDAFAAAELKTSYAIRDILGVEGFLEAVTWQNRKAVHTGIDSLLRNPVGHASHKQRRNELMVASYLQRYCVKNDTIGFFGPVGWAKFMPSGPSITVAPGANLLAERNVYFEVWCINAICAMFSKDKALQPWCIPRRKPSIYVDGLLLHTATGRPVKIPQAQSLLLQECNGVKNGHEIAQHLMSLHPALFPGEADILKSLNILRQMGFITWEFEVRDHWHSEELVRELTERIEDERLRKKVLNILDELEGERAAIVAAAGDALKLDEALGHLEDTFSRICSRNSTRAAGQTYAGRTLVYEDCRRDIEVTLGPEFLAQITPPMELLLAGARWCTHEASIGYRQLCREIYDELALQTGSASVDGSAFWYRIQPHLNGKAKVPVIEKLTADFQQRWADILLMKPEQRRIQLSSEELRPKVMETFAVPDAGWRDARYNSPDVMIDAPDAEAIRRGDFQFIMGEFHIGKSTLESPTFLLQHPSPEDILNGVQADFAWPRIMPLTPKHTPGTGRSNLTIGRPNDVFLEYGNGAPSPSPERTFSTGGVTIELYDGELYVRTRDGQLQFKLIDLLANPLSWLVVNCFRSVRTSDHMPRVTIDRCVIHREWWSFLASDAPFLHDKDGAERFLAIRRWARAQGIPRFVFVRAAVEVKPFYVDFDSPIYVSMFARSVRLTWERSPDDQVISITEMLPTHDRVWLPDAEGNRYTSELRMLAVDLTHPGPVTARG